MRALEGRIERLEDAEGVWQGHLPGVKSVKFKPLTGRAPRTSDDPRSVPHSIEPEIPRGLPPWLTRKTR